MLQYIFEPTTTLKNETLKHLADIDTAPVIILKPSLIKLTIINTETGETVFTNKEVN